MSAHVKLEVKLQVRNLCRDYPGGLGVTPANRNISFETSGGDIVWVRGRSGSGKTTLMNMITALDRPTSGSLAYLGRDYSALNDRQKTHMRRDAMGLMFQHFELLPMLSGYENIRVPYLLGKGGGGRNRKSRMAAEASNPAIDALVATIRDDLAFLAKKVTRISGGQRQIINIIRAVVHRPPLLIGDEITANLDVDQSHRVYALMRKMLRESGGMGIFISHDPVIASYCTRIFEMEDGVLEERPC